ncbi:MAG: SDR family NAD(P)-dependent oxidoreductase, partial [Methylobacteriaceae bacterium]|nr:SDR family NAD(P)-dependent oxidoreductase [Methylobacteriaceae bacterium]
MASIKDRLDFTGKTVLVTGASSPMGMGAGIARAFHELGAEIVSMDVNDGSALFSERYLFIGGDITDENAVREAARQVAGKHGALDVLVNNAGIIG